MKKTLLQFAWAVVNINLTLWVVIRDTLIQIDYGNTPITPTIEFIPNPDKKAN